MGTCEFHPEPAVTVVYFDHRAHKLCLRCKGWYRLMKRLRQTMKSDQVPSLRRLRTPALR